MEWEPRKGVEWRSPLLAELTAGLSGHYSFKGSRVSKEAVALNQGRAAKSQNRGRRALRTSVRAEPAGFADGPGGERGDSQGSPQGSTSATGSVE